MKCKLSTSNVFLRRLGAASIAVIISMVGAHTALAQSIWPDGGKHALSEHAEALVDDVAGGLVMITATKQKVKQSAPGLAPDSDLFGEFFKHFDRNGAMPDFSFGNAMPEIKPTSVSGTGFFVDSKGLIVTADALVTEADKLEAITSDGRAYSAELIGSDPVSGLALLRVDANQEFQALDWSPDILARGESILAVGQSEDFGPFLSWGLVAASTKRGELLVDDDASPALLGAPALDSKGRILAIYTGLGDAQTGMAVAISSNVAQRLVDDLASNGSVARGYLGVRIQPVTEDFVEELGLERVIGVIVTDVQPDTPADTVGIKSGDVILAINGESIVKPDELTRAVKELAPGTDVKLEVLRDGENLDIDVTLAALPAAELIQQPKSGEMVSDLGVSLQQLTPSLREAFGLSPDVNGVVVAAVDEDSTSGLQVGDVIVSIYRTPVASIDEVKAAVNEARTDGRSTLVALVDRDGNRTFVAIPFAAS